MWRSRKRGGGSHTHASRARAVPVHFGTADDLRDASEKTLLLCMPSPGEAGIAEQALDAFSGPYVAYVGEWLSGMTGTCRLDPTAAPALTSGIALW